MSFAEGFHAGTMAASLREQRKQEEKRAAQLTKSMRTGLVAAGVMTRDQVENMDGPALQAAIQGMMLKNSLDAAKRANTDADARDAETAAEQGFSADLPAVFQQIVARRSGQPDVGPPQEGQPWPPVAGEPMQPDEILGALFQTAAKHKMRADQTARTLDAVARFMAAMERTQPNGEPQFFTVDDVNKPLPKGWERIVTGPKTAQVVPVFDMSQMPDVPGYTGAPTGRGVTWLKTPDQHGVLTPAVNPITGEAMPGFYFDQTGKLHDLRDQMQKLTGASAPADVKAKPATKPKPSSVSKRWVFDENGNLTQSN